MEWIRGDVAAILAGAIVQSAITLTLHYPIQADPLTSCLVGLSAAFVVWRCWPIAPPRA